VQPADEAAPANPRALRPGNYVVVAAATRVSLTPAHLAATLGTRIDGNELHLTVAVDKLRFVLAGAFAAVEQAPVDASFDVSNPDAVKVVPSRDGKQLDTDAIGAAILRGSRSITATIRTEHPAHH